MERSTRILNYATGHAHCGSLKTGGKLILVIFLTNFLINLTLLRARDSVIKNTKLLKKYLRKLTLVVIYPPTGFRFQVLANICPEISAILGDFIKKYQEKEIPNRW